MELHTLRLAFGAKKAKKRKGRGQGSGKGGTSTKGHKGAQSRAGYKKKLHLESGQTPLQRRKPKFGFKNFNRKIFKPINLDRIEDVATRTNSLEITRTLLEEHGVIKKGDLYKILGKGPLTKKLRVHAPSFSVSAQQAIEAKDGEVHMLA